MDSGRTTPQTTANPWVGPPGARTHPPGSAPWLIQALGSHACGRAVQCHLRGRLHRRCVGGWVPVSVPTRVGATRMTAPPESIGREWEPGPLSRRRLFGKCLASRAGRPCAPQPAERPPAAPWAGPGRRPHCSSPGAGNQRQSASGARSAPWGSGQVPLEWWRCCQAFHDSPV